MLGNNERELLQDANQLRDEELLAGLDRLLRDDRALTAQLVVHIGEVDARGLYRVQAYASMFEYAVEALHMSESEAYTRIRAARLCREFPVVLGMLARGELHLSAVKLLAPVLTADNYDELLNAARFKSKRQVELVLAERFPKPDAQSVVRRLPAKPSGAVLPGAVSGALQLASVAVPEGSNSTSGPEPVNRRESAASLQLAPPAPEIVPLRAERYKVQFTANQRLHDKIAQAQGLLRHQVPDGDLATVVERALDLLIAERMKRHFAFVRRPRVKTGNKPSKPDSRHIPHEVRREAVARDGLQCSYVSDAGKRCEQRGLLQLHHEQAYGRGGLATTSNIRVFCRTHNQLLAERDYGRAFMQKRVAEARAQRSAVRSSREQRDESGTAEVEITPGAGSLSSRQPPLARQRT